jgi:predicted house-cleaning NTP pyrophosphatase (Maf/HAM1 superfamily)
MCKFLQNDFHEEKLNLYDEKNQRMTDGIKGLSIIGGDQMFFLHREIIAEPTNMWREDHSIDFLGEVSWRVVEEQGHERGEYTKKV